MDDPIKKVFDETMRREEKTINDYWTNAESTVFFRRNDDKNQTSNYVSIFYKADTAISGGKLLKFSGKTFLTINQETTENSYYRRSDLLETNMVLDTFSGGYETVIPCFAYDITNTSLDVGRVVTTANGYIELITEKNDTTDRIALDNRFTAMGATYKVINIYDKAGIKHIFVQRDTSDPDEITYTLAINGNATRITGTTATLTATAKISGETVNNPTVTWISSNVNIISIVNGVATFRAAGSATLTAKWEEHNITATQDIIVADGAPLVCEISGDGEITVGDSATYTATFYDAQSQEASGITPTWALTLTTAQNGKVTIASQSGNTVTIAVGDYSQLVNTEFTLNLTATGYVVTKSISIGESSGGGWI